MSFRRWRAWVDSLDTVKNIVGGTDGQFVAALAVGGSVLRFDTMQLVDAVGVGMGIATGLIAMAIV